MGRDSEPGRGSGRGRGRYQGRGRFRGGGGFTPKQNQSHTTKQEVKFVTSSSKQVHTYTTVKDEIMQKVQKMYGYEVAYSLRQLSEYDMSGTAKPVHQMSTGTNAEDKAEEQYGMDMMYQAKVNDYIKQSNLFTQNLRK